MSEHIRCSHGGGHNVNPQAADGVVDDVLVHSPAAQENKAQDYQQLVDENKQLKRKLQHLLERLREYEQNPSAPGRLVGRELHFFKPCHLYLFLCIYSSSSF